jgi:nicotinic acid phosphoribosyltransferase
MHKYATRNRPKIRAACATAALALLAGGCAAETSSSSDAAPDMDATMSGAMPHIEKGCKAFGSAAIMATGNEAKAFSDFIDIAEEEFAAALAIDSRFRGVNDALGLMGDPRMGRQSIGIISDFCTGMNQSGAFN